MSHSVVPEKSLSFLNSLSEIDRKIYEDRCLLECCFCHSTDNYSTAERRFLFYKYVKINNIPATTGCQSCLHYLGKHRCLYCAIDLESDNQCNCLSSNVSFDSKVCKECCGNNCIGSSQDKKFNGIYNKLDNDGIIEISDNDDVIEISDNEVILILDSDDVI